MIKNKNIFECIIINNNIWFPNYVVWGPPSAGHQRRTKIFKDAFPNMESAISSQKTWERLRKKHDDKRRIFKYSENEKILTEIDRRDFFTNAYGLPIEVGQNVLINNVVYEIKSLEVIKWAGLIAGYDIDNLRRKINISDYDLDKEENIWKRKE